MFPTTVSALLHVTFPAAASVLANVAAELTDNAPAIVTLPDTLAKPVIVVLPVASVFAIVAAPLTVNAPLTFAYEVAEMNPVIVVLPVASVFAIVAAPLTRIVPPIAVLDDIFAVPTTDKFALGDDVPTPTEFVRALINNVAESKLTFPTIACDVPVNDKLAAAVTVVVLIAMFDCIVLLDRTNVLAPTLALNEMLAAVMLVFEVDVNVLPAIPIDAPLADMFAVKNCVLVCNEFAADTKVLPVMIVFDVMFKLPLDDTFPPRR